MLSPCPQPVLEVRLELPLVAFESVVFSSIVVTLLSREFRIFVHLKVDHCVVAITTIK